MDRALYLWFNHLADRTAWAHGLARFYADGGIVLLALLTIAAAVDARRRDRLTQLAGAVWTAVAAIVALGLGQIVGAVVHRPRPYAVLTNVHLLVSRTTDSSLPSDHAIVAGAVAAGLLVSARRWGGVALAAAFAMAVTRVYVGAHYPGDVLAGLVLGAVVAVGLGQIIVPWFVSILERLQRTFIRPLVSSSRSAQV